MDSLYVIRSQNQYFSEQMFVFVVLHKNIRSFLYTIFGDFDCFAAQFWTIVRFSIILEIMILTDTPIFRLRWR